MAHALLHERGGSYSNTGTATIVCGRRGEALAPSWLPRRGHLACSHHAEFRLASEDHPDGVCTVSVSHHRGDGRFHITHRPCTGGSTSLLTGRVCGNADGVRAEVDPPGTDEDLAPFGPALAAAYRKATCYHCRHPHYVAPTGQSPAGAAPG